MLRELRMSFGGCTVSAIHERERRRERLRTELAAIDGITHGRFDAAGIEEELRAYLADWTSLARRHYAQTRQLLRKLLTIRIRVWQEGEKCYRYEGEAAVGRFFSGLVEVKRFGVPNGI